MTAPTDSFARDARVIGLIAAAHMMSHMFVFLLLPLSVRMQNELGFSYLEVGILAGAFAVGAAVCQTGVGFIVDRIGGRVPLIMGVAVLSGAVMGFGLVSSFWAMLPLAIIGGVANSVFHPADYAILSASVAEHRMGRAFSVHAVSGNTGWILALLGPDLADIVGLKGVFLVAGGIGIAVSFALLLQSRHLESADSKARRREQGGSTSDGIALLLTVPVILLFLFQMFHSMSLGGIRTFGIPALHELRGFEDTVLAKALIAYMVAASVGNLAGGWLVDRTGRPQLVFFGAIGTVFLAVNIIGAVSLPLYSIVALLMVSGVAHGAIMPTRDLLVRRISPPGQMGKVFGFTSTGLSIGGFVAPVLFGWVMDAGDPRWVFFGSAAVMLLAVATFVETSRNAGRARATA